MLGKFRSIFIVIVFEFIGKISYLSNYILWLKVMPLLVLSYIVQVVNNVNGYVTLGLVCDLAFQ